MYRMLTLRRDHWVPPRSTAGAELLAQPDASEPRWPVAPSIAANFALIVSSLMQRRSRNVGVRTA